MQKLKKWWPLPAAVIASAVFSTIGLFIDQSCSPIRGTFCSAWVKFQWETVLAGTLGLCGGIFVIASARMTIEHETRKYIASKMSNNDTISEHTRKLAHTCEIFLEVLERHGKAERDDTTSFPTWRFSDGSVELPHAQKTVSSAIMRLVQEDGGILKKILNDYKDLNPEIRQHAERILQSLDFNAEPDGRAVGDVNAWALEVGLSHMRAICHHDKVIHEIIENLTSKHRSAVA